MLDNLVHWVRTDGVDGYRCDVAFGVPVDFWEQARTALNRVNSHAILIAESGRPEELLHAFDMSCNFPYLTTLKHVFHDGAPASALRANHQESRAKFPQGSLFLRASDTTINNGRSSCLAKPECVRPTS